MGLRPRTLEDLGLTMSSLPSAAFWRGKRVLLTGHTGFKGGWTLLWLEQLGAEVTGFALPPEEPSFYELAKLSASCQSIFGDITDKVAVEAAVDRCNPEIVLHLAAQPIVRRSLSDPIETITTNVTGTANLLSALRERPQLSAIVVVTSDKVYRNAGEGLAFREGDCLGGKDPYSASKAAQDLIAHAYRQSFFDPAGIPLVTARGGNVIGGGDFAHDRLVPDCARAAATGGEMIVRHPNATRPWQHVLDCIAGYLLYAEALANRKDVPVTLNFGPDPSRSVTVRHLAESVLAALQHKSALRIQENAASIEVESLAVDPSCARESLNWRDHLVGDKAVTWTANWYGSWLRGENMLEFSISQFEKYYACEWKD